MLTLLCERLLSAIMLQIVSRANFERACLEHSSAHFVVVRRRSNSTTRTQNRIAATAWSEAIDGMVSNAFTMTCLKSPYLLLMSLSVGILQPQRDSENAVPSTVRSWISSPQAFSAMRALTSRLAW
jgi:hypothetical protein